jgi:transposase
VVKFGEFIMILELHRQGLKVAAIARQLGIDRKTVGKYISRGLEPPTYGPRPRRQKSTDPFLSYLRQRLAAFPGLTAVRLWREVRERGYAGGYTAVKRAVRDIRPDPITPFEVRFETPPGEQAQVDLARFEVEFTDERGVTRIVWLFYSILPDPCRPRVCSATGYPVGERPAYTRREIGLCYASRKLLRTL